MTPRGSLSEPLQEPELLEKVHVSFPLGGVGFGRYTALARRYEAGEEQWYLAELEPVSARTARDWLVYIANEIAGTLSHGHALSTEQAAAIPSLRALQYAWKAAGAAYNDSLPAGQGWMSGMEGLG